MNLEFEDGFELIIEANNKDQEEKSFQVWLTIYPNMDNENFIPFSKYYEMSTGVSTSDVEEIENSKETKEQLLARLEEERKKFG